MAHCATLSRRGESGRSSKRIYGGHAKCSRSGVSQCTTSLKPGKTIARDVNIKIWTFGDRRSTISFARTADNHEHEEICLNCFEDYKDAKKDSNTVTLRVRKGEGKGSRRQRGGILSSGRARRSRQSRRRPRRPVARPPTASAASKPASRLTPYPTASRKLEWLKLEFDEKRIIRSDFCKFWAEA